MQVTTLSTNEAKATAVLAAAAQQPPQQQQEQEHTGQQQSSYPADAVVLAAGVGSPALALQLGLELPLLHKPAAIVMTKPVPTGLVRHMVIGDAVFILQVCTNGATQCALRPCAATLACCDNFVTPKAEHTTSMATPLPERPLCITAVVR